MATLGCESACMEETNATSSTPAAPGPDDPRYTLAKVVDAVGTLIEATPPGALANPTPCADFTTKELFEHLVFIVRRVGAVGRGEHWSTVEQQATDAGWAQDYRTAAHEIMLAWGDPALLEKSHEVPWGEFPGAVLMYSYAAELAVHGWDLAQATGAEFSLDDELLEGALFAAKQIPAEGRDDPEMPFGEVVDPGQDAPVLLQMAGWMGRSVA